MSKVIKPERNSSWLFGGNERAIHDQEAEGARSLLESDQLPVDGSPGGRRALSAEELEAWEMTGIEFGPISDDIFRDAKLPSGWSRLPRLQTPRKVLGLIMSEFKKLELVPCIGAELLDDESDNELQEAGFYTHGDGIELVDLEWRRARRLPRNETLFRGIVRPDYSPMGSDPLVRNLTLWRFKRCSS